MFRQRREGVTSGIQIILRRLDVWYAAVRSTERREEKKRKGHPEEAAHPQSERGREVSQILPISDRLHLSRYLLYFVVKKLQIAIPHRHMMSHP